MTLGEKIVALRKSRGLSQEQLAEKLGVSRQAVSKWELNESMPDVEKVVALSGLFGVTTDYLIIDNTTDEVTALSINSIKPKNFISKKSIGIALICFGVLWMVGLKILSVIIAAKVKVYSSYSGEYGFFPHITGLGLLISFIVFAVLIISGIIVWAGNADKKFETVAAEFIVFVGRKLKELFKLIWKKLFGAKEIAEGELD